MKRWTALRKLWSPFSESCASVYAASACYYILLSLLPSALLFLSVLPYLPVPNHTWQLWIQQLLPEPFIPIAAYVLELVHGSDSVALLSVSAVVTLWSASKGILAITDGLNAVLEHFERHRFLRRRINGMLSFLFTMVLLAIVLLAQSLFSGFFTVVFLMLLFTMVYWLLPRRELPFRYCCLGGAFTAAGWFLFSFLFSIYVNHFASFQRLYGSVGLLLLACIWLQICILLVLYGALLSNLVYKKAYHPLQILKDVFS